MPSTALHQLGLFVVEFQHLEDAVNEIIVLMANADDEIVRILINELEYSKRLKAADVAFARVVDLHPTAVPDAKKQFHVLMDELHKLGERRNELVHSRYVRWFNVHGKEGLLRTNSRLRAGRGEREEKEEEIQPESFQKDHERLRNAAIDLERFRLQLIEWKCPSGA